jgi:hypothetical protein
VLGAPERHTIPITVSRETYEKPRRAQALSRHAIPNGDPAVIVDRALTLLVDKLEPRAAPRLSSPARTQPGSFVSPSVIE